jgi:hypothetical protein
MPVTPRHAAVALVTMLVACSIPPDRVFVPGKPFTHVIEVRTEQGAAADIRVGDWLTLHGRRSTGPWIEVDRKSLGPDGCWVAPPPPAVEAQVADDLTWTAEPKDNAEFNSGVRPDHARLVRFAAPGRYSLRASSATWCRPRVASNALTVVVRD